MSSDSSDPKNPLAAFLGNAFLVAIPLVLIVMLGIVGSAFVGGMKKKPKKEAVAAAAAPAPAAGQAPAPAAGAAPAAPAAGGAPAPAPAAAIDPAVMALGKQSYMLCAACHGPDGTGLKAGPALMAPSLVGSKVLLGDPDQSLLVVLKGIAKENMNFMGVMAPLAAGLDDQKLAAVLTYTRNEWGNSAPAVTVEQAAAARAKFADVNAPAGVKRAEIEAIVAAHKK
jgi:mono/diheme cytochrome c family protein